MKYLKKYKPFIELITENKTEALRKKWVPLLSDKFGIDTQKANTLFNDLSEIDDLTTNKVYLQWVLNNAMRTFNSFNEVDSFIDEDFYKWKEYLKIYHKVKYKLPIDQKDIQSLSVKELTDIALQFKDKEKEIGTKNEVLDKKYKIAENEEYLVYWFKDSTPEDFKFYQLVSTNTEWCTRPDYTTFKGHVKDSPLIIFINKADRNNKYQLHGDSLQFKDKNDREIDQQLAKSLIDIIYDYLPDDFVTKVQTEDSFGFIDKKGNIIAKGFKYVGSFSEGSAMVEFQDNSLGFIDKKGNIIAKGFKNAGLFSEGFAAIQFQDNSYGFIDKKGNIIAKRFESVYPFKEGFSCVRFQDNSCGFIDKKGNILAKGFVSASPFEEGFAWVQFPTIISPLALLYDKFQDNSWGFIDNKGKIYKKNKTTLINKNNPRLKGIEIYPDKFIQ